MSKDETSAGGLFSKVVRFVRNPATQWNDLDHDSTSSSEGSVSKQALKEMIERKRRNDFVRKREFDMLRKLRRREITGASMSEAMARPSFFQSSLPSRPDDRAQTLKKIDEIEAQMSMQWWKTKHGSAASSTLPPTSEFPSSQSSHSQSSGMGGSGASAARANNLGFAQTAPNPLNAGYGPGDSPASSIANAPTAPMSLPGVGMPPLPASARAPATSPTSVATQRAPAPIAAAPTASFKAAQPVAQSTLSPNTAKSQGARPVSVLTKPPLVGGLAAAYDGGATTGFSASKLFALEVDEVQHDPELEEAAIRFANSDDAGAEGGLIEALSPKGARHQHEDTWLTLFDFYRATGRADRFDGLAIDFASKFGRSAPMWFSIPEMVGRLGKAASSDAASDKKSDWRCPAQLGIQTLAAMNAALSRAEQPWQLDWSNLQNIEEPAVAGLTKLFESWAGQKLQLRFAGADKLEAVLRKAAPSGDKSKPQEVWNLLLQYMRVTHRPDEFEMAALDFCVTYEVSPPSWEAAKCSCKCLDEDGQTGLSQTIIGTATHEAAPTNMGDPTGLSHLTAHLSSVELSGQIAGEPKLVLDQLEERLAGADVMVISCAKLIRVDFSAAGSLLNWVSARQAEGRMVQFTDVHRLVAAFFHVIGISEYAKVVTRHD